MRSLKSQLFAVASASLLLSVAVSAQAQNLEARVDAAVKKLQAACANDVKSYCGQVSPGEGRLVLCMMAHEDKVSNQCEFALFEASRNLERALDKVEMAADACWSDIEKNCAGTAIGGKRIIQCLTEKKASLQQSCQAVLSKITAK